MRIAVVGIGGVGGFFGGKLAARYEGGRPHEVCFVARGAHLDAMRTRGLKVRTPTGDFTAVPWCATAHPRELGSVDVALFCVKGYDLEEAATAMRPVVSESTVVIPLLNGVDNARVLRGVFPGATVLNGCVYISSHVVEPGVVEQTGGSGRLLFGPEEGTVEPYRRLEEVFHEASINAQLTGSITQEVWAKFMFISPVGVVTALTGKSIGQVLDDQKAREMLEGMMAELEAVARAQGVQLPADIVARSLDSAAAFPHDTRSSLQLDVEQGRRAELETFVGYVTQKATELGLDAPLYHAAERRLLRQTP
ncbi:MAG: ketopantoate reductase family protein [Chloroflexota bacterium]